MSEVKAACTGTAIVVNPPKAMDKMNGLKELTPTEDVAGDAVVVASATATATAAVIPTKVVESVDMDDDLVDSIIEEDNGVDGVMLDEDMDKYIEEDLDDMNVDGDEDDDDLVMDEGVEDGEVASELATTVTAKNPDNENEEQTSQSKKISYQKDNERVENKTSVSDKSVTITPVVGATKEKTTIVETAEQEKKENGVGNKKNTSSGSNPIKIVKEKSDEAAADEAAKKDEKSVSIPSDSNSDGEQDVIKTLNKPKERNGTCDSPAAGGGDVGGGGATTGAAANEDIHEILSDKEDCVLIDDEDDDEDDSITIEKKSMPNNVTSSTNNQSVRFWPSNNSSGSSNNKSRTSLRMRESDSDDDIQEIIDDPVELNSSGTTIQPVSKRPKLSMLPSSTTRHLPADLSISSSSGPANNNSKDSLSMVSISGTKPTTNNRGGSSNNDNNNISSSSSSNIFNSISIPTQIGNNVSITPSTGSNSASATAAANAMQLASNIRATITPINAASIANANMKMMAGGVQQQAQNLTMPQAAMQMQQQPTILLPALTDDMFVLEAPSFIVPYIYEKPPPENLKEVVEEMRKVIDDQKKKDNSNTVVVIDDDSPTMSSLLKSAAEDGQAKGAAKRKRKSGKNPDDSWDESDESTDDDASDSETRTKVLIKEAKQDIETIILPEPKHMLDNSQVKLANPDNYFESPLGRFFMDIGVNLVQEHVQTDLLRLQKRKMSRDQGNVHMQTAINALMKNLDTSRKHNATFKHESKRCEFCNYKTESSLSMANHYEKPHLKGNAYKCNFCEFEARPAHDILFHMEAVHNMKSKLEKPLSYHQCPNCPFEDNGKSKLARHTLACSKKFMPENNLLPPPDWDPPAKIPRVKPRHGLVGTATAYQAMAAQQQRINAATGMLNRINSMGGVQANSNVNAMNAANAYNLTNQQNRNAFGQPMNVQMNNGGNMMMNSNNSQSNRMKSGGRNVPGMGANKGPVGTNMRQGGSGGGGGQGQNMQNHMMMSNSMMLQHNLNQLAAVAAANKLNTTQLLQMANQAGIIQNPHNSLTIQTSNQGSKSSKNMQQPSISITPLPRQGAGANSMTPQATMQAAQAAAAMKATGSGMPTMKPGQHPTAGGKSTFVICEICDGYIKDLDQLRSHMQLIHKVKIHPKMIYNRPPLNCQKCQYRFFTDQGLERHLLGSHGLVTSSMQEAANCGQDSGRCPVCGKVYQWKLLNHVSRDHNMTLKPAHLSYKCTVCTATFGMYKQFENHVYSAHSTVAKKSSDGKRGGGGSGSSSKSGGGGGGSSSAVGGGSSAALKPLKISDEITIIPQSASSAHKSNVSKTQTIEIE